MKRKVIQLAGKTLVVSMPSKWVKKHNINKGDEILLEERGSKLIIGSEKELSHEKTELNIVDLEPMVKRALGAVYKTGYDEVEVILEPKEFETAQEVIREEFIGFEVVYQGKSRLKVKKISSIDKQEFDIMLRRTFLIINQMANESLEAVQKSDTNWLKTIAFMDKDINKYADFCRRVLNKYGYTKFRVTPPLYFIVEQLEKIGDSYEDISDYVIKNKTKPSKETLELYKEVNHFFNTFYELFYRFDLKQLAMFGRKRYELIKKFNNLFEKCDRKEMMILLYLYTILDNTFDMNGALMAMNL